MSASVVYRGLRGCNLRCRGRITRHSEKAAAERPERDQERETRCVPAIRQAVLHRPLTDDILTIPGPIKNFPHFPSGFHSIQNGVGAASISPLSFLVQSPQLCPKPTTAWLTQRRRGW